MTWRSPDGDTVNEIEHILIQKKHSSSLKDVRCKRVVNVDWDYYMVMAEILARISINKTHKVQKVQKYNVQSLENEDLWQAFRSKIIEFNESTYADEESQKEIESNGLYVKR